MGPRSQRSHRMCYPATKDDHTACILQLVHLYPSAALFNVPGRVNGNLTVTIPYSQMGNPEVLSSPGNNGHVRVFIQTWLAKKEGLIRE